MQDTLHYRINQVFFFGGMLMYLFVLLYWWEGINYYNILNIVTFISYSYLIWICMDKPDEYFTNMRLGVTVFIYSFIFVAMYLLMSYTYSDYVLIFNGLDSQAYENYSSHMTDMSFPAAFYYISHIYTFDDWGAPLVMTAILKIIPSKYFFLFCQIIMNVVGTLCLFSISKSIMPKKYGYMAVLVYAISPYSIFFMSSMLKEEIMVLLIIISIFFLYKYRNSRDPFCILIGGGASLLILFFRVPIAIFVWLVYAVTLLLDSKGHIQRGLVYLLLISGFILAVGILQYSSDRYVNNMATYMFESTTLFQKVVLAAGALIGPFPDLLQLPSQNISYKPMYAPGVLYKFLLFFPFWKGFIYCLKSKATEVIPLYLFCLLEMVGLVSVFDGLEVRKAFPHFSLFILAAFWFMSRYDIDTTDEIRHSRYYYWANKEFAVSIWIVLIVTLAWNTMIRVSHL